MRWSCLILLVFLQSRKHHYFHCLSRRSKVTERVKPLYPDSRAWKWQKQHSHELLCLGPGTHFCILLMSVPFWSEKGPTFSQFWTASNVESCFGHAEVPSRTFTSTSEHRLSIAWPVAKKRFWIPFVLPFHVAQRKLKRKSSLKLSSIWKNK